MAHKTKFMQLCPYCGAEDYQLDSKCPNCGAPLPKPEVLNPPAPPPLQQPPIVVVRHEEHVPQKHNGSAIRTTLAIIIGIPVILIIGRIALVASRHTAKNSKTVNVASDIPKHSYNKWLVTDATSSLNNGSPLMARLFSEDDIQFNGTSQKAVLYCQCIDGKLESHIYTGVRPDPVRSKSSLSLVKLTFDNQRPIQQVWTLRTTNDGLTAPDAKDFIGRLKRAIRVKIEITPYKGTTQTVGFYVLGVDDFYPALMKTCGGN